jgi:isopenicillin-N epimerase
LDPAYLQHWTLDPECVFLNHGSYGACPARVQLRQQRLREELEQQPVRFLRGRTALFDRSREAAAALLHCDPQDLALIPNATHGVNAVLRSLDFASGDELLVTDHEYNACRNALDFVAARAGATVKVVDLPLPLVSADQVVEVLLAAVGPRTRLCLVDHITSPTAMRLPVERIVPALQERGVEVLVDGAHAPGQVPVDLSALDADYWTGNLHKWACAPKGSAVLYVKRAHQERIRPTVISHGANADFTDRSRFLQEFDWTGTFDPSAWACIADALSFVGSLLDGGWSAVMERNHRLALAMRRMLCERWGTEPICPDDMVGTMAAVPLPDGLQGRDAGEFFHTLSVEGGIEIPIIPWPRPIGTLARFSSHLYNEPADYAKLADAVDALLD